MPFFIKNSKILILLLGVMLGVLGNQLIAQTSYYSKATGAANVLSTWGTNTDGSGTSPADFVSGDIFIVRSGSSLTTSGTLTIDDAAIDNAGVLRIASGGLLTASHAIDFINGSATGATFEIENNGRYVHALSTNIGTTILSATILNFFPGSTFEMNTSGTHSGLSVAIFDNFTVSGSATILISAGGITLYVANILTIESGATLRFSSTAATTSINDAGNLTTAGTGVLRMAGSNSVNLPPSITWNFQVNYDRIAGNQRIQPGTYTNLNATGGNREVAAGAVINISGTFTPGAGPYTLNANSTFEFSANGSLSIPALPYQNLTISGTGTKSISAPLTISGALIVSNVSGFLDINGQTLTLNGDATLTNGKLIGSSTSNLTISGASGTNASIGFSQSGSNNQLNTLTINRTTGGGAILQDNVNIVNRLVVTSGNLNTNNSVIGLLSTGISSTARVDQVTGSISYGGSGGIRVERFIPSGFRSYRDLTPSVYTFSSHILDNWQEQGSSPTGFGTHITGVQGSPGVDLASGLDKTQTGNVSMFTYNGATFPSVTNTASTRLDPYQGYRILIRGDRNVNLLQVPTPTTMNQATTLRATGKLIYGDVTYSTSGVTNGVYNSSFALNGSSSTGFSLIGNPYACPVSWTSVLSNGSTSNIQNTYWYFDPQQGINGIYKTVIRIGSLSNPNGSTFVASAGPGNAGDLIQPGQAIFIRNDNSTSPSIQFKESNKDVSSSALSVFSTPLILYNLINKLDITIEKTNSSGRRLFLDGNTLVFGSDYTNNISTKEDAGKISNGSENMAIVNTSNGTNLLSIESRKLVTEQDTIALRLWQVVNNDAYTLNIMPKGFSSNGRMAFLNDAYLKKQTFIRNDKDTIKINFTTLNTDSSSYFRRFSLVFKQPIALSNNASDATLTGTSTGYAIGLNWTIANDNNQLYYELEKSNNSIEYTTIARVFADGSGSYSFTDTSINNGKVYYRVRYYNSEAQYGLTNTVLMEPSNKTTSIAVYPNPISGNTLNIQMNQLEPGNYQLAIIDNQGRVLNTQQIIHQNNSSTIPVRFNQTFTNGVYRLKLTHVTSMKVYTTNIVFQNK